MKKLLCINTLEIERKNSSKYTFREGERYNGNKINDNWWCIDSVGVDASVFDKYFIDEKYISGYVKKQDDELDVVTKE